MSRPGSLLVPLLLFAACASTVPGGAPADGDADGDGDDDIDAGDGSDSDDIDASARPDAPEIDAADDVVRVLYVSTVGADFHPGIDPAKPIRHLNIALERATMCTPDPCELRLATGEYEEAIELRNGVNIVGGYHPDFSLQDTHTYPVTITADVARVVVADGLTRPTTLSGLTIKGADFSTHTEGASSYALWVRDSADHLKVFQVTLVGGKAGRGLDGEDGVLQSCTSSGGPGGEAVDCSGSGGGVGNAGADPSVGGGGGGHGGSNCPNACPLVGDDGVSGGSTGNNGSNGADGSAGTPASDLDGDFLSDMWVGSAGGSGGRGLTGTGGGGGGSGGSKRFRACFNCNTLLGGRGGNGAPGGCGGGGGQAGSPGGASIALTVIRSTVRWGELSIEGGVGGRGGAGGDGHSGGPGGTDGSVGRQDKQQQQCGLITYRSGAGASGGVGGHGGSGGGGAGGIGGASIAVALVGGGALMGDEPGTPLVGAGTPGAGGPGGTGASTAPIGETGLAGAVVTY